MASKTEGIPPPGMRNTKKSIIAGLKVRRGTVITGKKTMLREKRLSDAHNDYTWQSDPELARLDAATMTNVSFPVYLLDYTDQLHDPGLNRFPLAVENLDGKHIGNCTCYDIDEACSEAELGIMIGNREYWDMGYGADAIIAMVDHVFLHSSLNRIYLKTLSWNLRAQRCFRNCGFTPCGQMSRDGDDFMLMDIKREQWEKRQERR